MPERQSGKTGRVVEVTPSLVEEDIVTKVLSFLPDRDSSKTNLAYADVVVALDADTVFRIASMTKPMAAVAGLTLMEQGKLPLQAKVADYYPAFADMKVGVQQADGIGLGVVGTEGVGADELRQPVGLVRVGAANGPHLVQDHRHAGLLVDARAGRVRAREGDLGDAGM